MLNTILLIIVVIFQIYLAYKVAKIGKTPESREQTDKNSEDLDALYNEAKEIVIKGGRASAALLQRRLRIGYARAAMLLDKLEEDSIISPAEGANSRKVLK